MRNKLIAVGFLVSLMGSASFPVIASEDDLVMTFGLRFWDAKWSSWDVLPPIYTDFGTIPAASQNYSSGYELASIPTISIRYRDLLFSGSRFLAQTYQFNGDSGGFSAKREETDILVGYYILPTLAITIGNKEVKQDFNGAGFRYAGPVIGAVASAPLTKGFSLYGNLGYGRLKANLPSYASDASGSSSLDANYYLGEVGVAYSFDIRTSVPGAKALTATFGYRNQVLATQDYQLAGSNRKTELRDTTEGFSMGLSVSF